MYELIITEKPAAAKKIADALADTKAKRETTKRSRLHKIIPMINEGIGLHDKYKNR